MRDITYVDVIGRYSKPRYPEKALEELTRLVSVLRGDEEAAPIEDECEIRNVARRLGRERMNQLVADYETGMSTTELMNTYQLSKSSVLNVLAKNDTQMRRQPITDEQLATATTLYNDGSSLVKVSELIHVPSETIRRGLINATVTLRNRGGSRGRP